MIRKTLILLILSLILAGCATKPPQNPHNICSIFNQYPKWYWSAQKTQKRWRLPMSVLMAVMYQESSFTGQIKPPRRKLLGFIPWFRPTSAFGYAQVVDGTWHNYQRSTGNTGANRDNFSDAADFIGWYSDQAHRRVKISKGDPYGVYLTYHEGIGGYSRGTYKRKRWLLNVANKVRNRAWMYHAQLVKCQASLPKKHWWNFS